MLDSTRKDRTQPLRKRRAPLESTCTRDCLSHPEHVALRTIRSSPQNPNHRRKPRVRAAVRVIRPHICARPRPCSPNEPLGSILRPHKVAVLLTFHNGPIQVLRPASSRRAGFLVAPARSRCPPIPTRSLPSKPTPPPRSKNTRSRRLARDASTSSTDHMRPAAHPPLVGHSC